MFTIDYKRSGTFVKIKQEERVKKKTINLTSFNRTVEIERQLFERSRQLRLCTVETRNNDTCLSVWSNHRSIRFVYKMQPLFRTQKETTKTLSVDRCSKNMRKKNGLCRRVRMFVCGTETFIWTFSLVTNSANAEKRTKDACKRKKN